MDAPLPGAPLATACMLEAAEIENVFLTSATILLANS